MVRSEYRIAVAKDVPIDSSWEKGDTTTYSDFGRRMERDQQRGL